MAPLARRSWAPRGQTPVLTQRGRSRRKVSVIAALTISPCRRRIRSYFGMLPDANYDGEQILYFLQQLVRRQRGPLELIWDRLPAHRGAPVGPWFTRHRTRLRVHLLPAYAPELNPVELIWSYAKMNPLANLAPREADDLLAETQRALLGIAAEEPLLRSFVRHCPLSLRL